MKMEDPLRTILEKETVAEVEEIQLPPDATSLDLMQAVYRDRAQPMPLRMRAAVAALPFEHPRLSVNANTDIGNFGAQMEEIARRSGKSNVIDAKANYKTPQVLPIQTDPEGRKC